MVSRYLIWPLVLFHTIASAQKPLTSPPRPIPNIVEAEDFIGKHWQMDIGDIITDTIGYTYFATRNGVQRFDGFQLRPLYPDATAAQFRFHRFVKGAKNKLWLLATGTVAYIEGDSIKSYSLPDGMLGGEIETFYPDESGLIHLSLKQKGYFTLDPINGTIEKPFENNANVYGYCITHLQDGTPFFFSVQDASQQKKNIGIYYLNDGVAKLICNTADKELSPDASLSACTDGTLFFSTGGYEILKLRKDSLLFKQPFRHKARGLFADSRNDLWIGTLDHGIFKVLNNKLTQVQQHLEYDEAAVVAEDANGGLWVKSVVRSFGYIPHPEILRHSNNNGMPYFEEIYEILQTKEDIVYIGAPLGMYTLSDTTKYTPIPRGDHLEGTRSHDIHPFCCLSDTINDRIWFGFRGKAMSRGRKEQWQTYVLDTSLFKNTIVWTLKVLPDGTMMGSTGDCVFTIKDGKAIPISEIGAHRILQFDVDNKGVIWVGTADGLYTLENGAFKRPDFLKEGEFEKECYLVKHDRGTLWIHPQWGYLHRIKAQTVEQVVDDLGEPVKLRGYTITSKGHFWGLALKDKRFTICKIKSDANIPTVNYYEYGNVMEVSNNRRGAFLATDTCVVWSTPEGVFRANVEELREQHIATAKVRELRINHQVVKLKSRYALNHTENYLNLAFDGISYSRSPLEFQYKMEGLDTSWCTTEYPQVQYTNLSAGDYEFQVQVRALNSSGAWSKTDSIHLSIAQPYWETLLFKIAVSLALILIGAILVYSRSRYLVKKERANSAIALKMLRLELRALKAQINPHFTFNAISSAIFFITNNQKERARNYLIRFSKLIRLALENSEKNEVSLEDEIELITKYIAIESERFEENGIEFEVILERPEMGEIKIPPALFQPYIENAIWHGLKNKKGQRRIKLHCSLEKNQLKLAIEDNGIGREASARFENASKHQSFGMMIASRRIELLNQESFQNTLIDDLKDDSNQALGTRVSIWLPVAV